MATRNDARGARTLPLPDPKIPHGPYRPFATDPGWSAAWWWLGIPLLIAAFVLGSYALSPAWYGRNVIPEGYGLLEFGQFLIALAGLFVGASLLLLPFVRARPFVLTVALLGTLSCFYIAGEEMSWGQHFFHWNTPEYWSLVNRQQETNLHNTYYVFEKLPRNILEFAVVIGGLIVPLAAYFYPALRVNRLSLFLPPAAIMPTALGTVLFKVIDRVHQSGYWQSLLQRPSETIELFLYLFILIYLVLYARRIKELEVAENAFPK